MSTAQLGLRDRPSTQAGLTQAVANLGKFRLGWPRNFLKRFTDRKAAGEGCQGPPVVL